MQPARDERSFQRAPVGRFVVVGTSFVWCHSPTLCGSIGWGHPTEEDTRRTVAAFDAIDRLAPQFDVILDGSAIEKVDSPSLSLLIEWTRRRFDELQRRVRGRVGVLADDGVASAIMAGIGPLLGGPGAVTLVREAREGFQRLLPVGGDALYDELMALYQGARGLSPVLLRLRPLLRAHAGRLPVAVAAGELGLSVRSLQRELLAGGRSYRGEQQEARFVAARALLATAEKITAIAAQLGLSESGLNGLIRARTGLTPGELRRTLR